MNTVTIPRLIKQSAFLLSMVGFSLLTACGGGDDKKSSSSSSSSTSSSHIFVPTPVTPAGSGIWPDIKISASGTKTLKFEWTDSNIPSGTTYYKLFKKADSNSNFEQIGVNFTDLNITDSISVHLTDWVNNRYKVQACNETACVDSDEKVINSAMLSAITYIKASNAEADDWFGWSIAISGDGNTLAVGAPGEDSNTTGVNQYETDPNTSPNSGAVYVFIKNEAGDWQQEAYLKASNTEQPNVEPNLTQLPNDRFGYQVALSNDGNTLAVSAILEDSLATGINCYQDDIEYATNSFASNSSATTVLRHLSANVGAVYIFKRTTSVWQQNAYLKAMKFSPNAEFGLTLTMSGDGKTVAVGTPLEETLASGIINQGSSSSAECIDYNASDFSSSASSTDSSSISSAATISQSNSSFAYTGGTNSGAVYIFKEGDAGWAHEAFVKASDANPYDAFGGSISLSQDGNTLAVGATGEDSKDTSAANDTTTFVGYLFPLNNGGVYIFARNSNEWVQQAKIKPSNNVWNQQFGFSVALSGDGNTLAVGTPGDWSKVNGNGSDYNIETDVVLPNFGSPSYGAAYTFRKTESTWSQQAYIKASNPHIGDKFGSCVALSHTGDILAIGSPIESSLAKGINGDQLDTSSALSGAAYVFSLTGSSWVQKSYVKAPNSDANDRFAHALGLDASGETLTIGAHRESSNAKGVNGDRDNNSAAASGAVYLY